MCGILGIHSEAPVQMDDHLQVLAHRGPDHSGALRLNNMIFGHTRLSIVDVAHGQQPLQSPDGRYSLIANGEIYNHEALRRRFPDYDFQTDSDSEVILALYERYGVHAVEYLDGMFAFALYDAHDDTLYMARDPLGIKPLYYGWQGTSLCFASELKSLQDLADDLNEFPPGHYYLNGDMVPYYDLNRVADGVVDHPAPSLGEIRQVLTAAVRKRLMADVEVGVYLSGGLDSTIIAALVAQELPRVHSFAVGTEGSEDLINARRAAEYLGTQHHEAIYDADDILEALPEIIYYLESYDPSLVASAIPNYFLARLTRQYVTVVLTGEGADELFAGYHYLKDIDEQDLSAELIALTGSLYNCNLQRCDRMTMAHSIEARVPFLDVDFISLAMRVPGHEKIHPATQMEKYALRQAFVDIVPDHVVWRKKEQFAIGSGSRGLMRDLAGSLISDDEFAREAHHIQHTAGVQIASKEMLLYFRHFQAFFSPQTFDIVKVWRGRTVA